MNFALANIYGPAGSLQRARLYAPDGSTLSDLALTEGSAETFSGTVALSPTPADSASPYEFEVRQVTAQSGAAFDASTTITISRGTYGYVSGGAWTDLGSNGEIQSFSRTLRFRFRVGSTLTDATSVKLSDPTGAFGLRRTDTDEIIVVDGTDFTHDATGTYSYLVSIIAGVPYEYWVEWVYAGETQRQLRTFIAATSETEAGRYTTANLVFQRFGRKNVVAWSSTEGDGTEDANAITAAIAWAEDFIDAFFAGSIYTIPFVATGASLPHNLTNWATVGAGWWLFTKRGLLNEGASTVIDPLWDKAQAEMQRYRAGFPMQLQGVQLNSAVSLGVTIVDPRANVISDGAALLPTSQSRRGGVRWIQGYGPVLNGQ